MYPAGIKKKRLDDSNLLFQMHVVCIIMQDVAPLSNSCKDSTFISITIVIYK